MKILCQNYGTLIARYKAFAESKEMKVLVVFGDPGTGKSFLADKFFPEEPGKVFPVRGRLTALALWKICKANPDATFVLDDVADILKDLDKAMILKQLCGSGDVRKVSWLTYRTIPKPKDGEDAVTQDSDFEFRGKVLILANEFKIFNRDFGAIENRGMVVEFLPTAIEVHKDVDSWRSDAKRTLGDDLEVSTVDSEVFDYIGENLDKVWVPSIRHYIAASEDKRAGLPWKDTLEEYWLQVDEAGLMRRLLLDKSLTKGDRCRLWCAVTGLQKSQYYDTKSRVEVAMNLEPHKGTVTVAKNALKQKADTTARAEKKIPTEQPAAPKSLPASSQGSEEGLAGAANAQGNAEPVGGEK